MPDDLRHFGSLETASHREVHVHALDALLGLHADQRGARRVHREPLLRHESKIGAADVVSRLHQFERALVVGERLRENLFAIARRDF